MVAAGACHLQLVRAISLTFGCGSTALQAKVVLNMMVCMFTEYCEKPFTIEPCDVIMPDGSKHSYPVSDLTHHRGGALTPKHTAGKTHARTSRHAMLPLWQ